VARHNALGKSYTEFFKVEENSEKISWQIEKHSV
jgi:hypothetical protein